MTLDALALDRSAPESLQTQLYEQLRELIEAGCLKPGARLPSTRQFAQDLGISRNTVIWAYERLSGEGYVTTGQGSRTLVAECSPRSPVIEAPPDAGMDALDESALLDAVDQLDAPEMSSYHVGLRPFTPDVQYFPFKTWQKLVARRFCNWGREFFGYGQLFGYDPLRQLVADYIWANRGVRCDWRQIFITNGAQAALDIASRLVLKPDDTVWMEEPGYHHAHTVFVERGANIHPLKVDFTSGWQVESPPDSAKLIYVTPSCQQPLCRTMTEQQRIDIVRIAYEKNSWIVEDDFDCEFRGSAPYVPSIHSMDSREKTIYIGTFTKILFPSLRLGFFVVPHGLVPAAEKVIVSSGHFAGIPLQAALTDFIACGAFALHLRKMRGIYAERRADFIERANERLSEWITPQTDGSGLQIPFLLTRPFADSEIAREANARHLNVFNLSVFYRHEKQHGFILGYAAMNKREMVDNMELLRSVFIDHEERKNGGIVRY
ncbi:MAG: PLP-dependent aminotransferase family protein [Sphingomonas bacterium]